jgi:tetratricopeptide (TPR) repeat protein
MAIIMLAGPGCRALRCDKATDESLAAARRLSLQGLEAQQHGGWDQAEALFATAVQRGPGDERARCGYAESLWKRGAQDQAVAHMEEAVRLSGNDPERRVQLGGMYLYRGELPRADQQADLAIAANPQLAGAWSLRGQVLQAQGQRHEALASFHRALSYREPCPEAQLAMAEIYGQEHRPQRALATLQALTESYPPGQAPVEVLTREAFALRDLGRDADAARTLAQATERHPFSVELF